MQKGLGDRRFFFQAEDGIRDHCVTGVQTCALPISGYTLPAMGETRVDLLHLLEDLRDAYPGATEERSEERRVGKECRSRWSTYHSQKNQLREGNKRDDNDIALTPDILCMVYSDNIA